MTPHQRKIAAAASALLRWFSADARDLPWRRTRDPYAVWVSEIMLQQTRVKTVIPYWNRWMAELPTIQAVAKADPARLHKLWEGLGYYTRVRNLQEAARQIVSRHGGTFPPRFEDVLALKGVGRYTAGAVCSIAYDHPVPVVDGNVIRVLARVFGIRGFVKDKKVAAKFWNLAEQLVTCADSLNVPGSCSALNQSLMELGALVCSPRTPNCGQCPLSQICVARKLGLQEKLPDLGRREKASARTFAAFIVKRNGRYLLRQRPAGVVNAHLWEFPNVEIPAGTTVQDYLRDTGSPFRVENSKPLCAIRHSITRYRIALDAFQASLLGGKKPAGVKWLSSTRLDLLAMPAAHKKILRLIESL